MNLIRLASIVIYLFVLLILVKPLGLYMARVYQGERTMLSPIILLRLNDFSTVLRESNPMRRWDGKHMRGHCCYSI